MRLKNDTENFSASVKISVTCFLRFGLVSKLGLKVKLYSSRWIIA